MMPPALVVARPIPSEDGRPRVQLVIEIAREDAAFVAAQLTHRADQMLVGHPDTALVRAVAAVFEDAHATRP